MSLLISLKAAIKLASFLHFHVQILISNTRRWKFGKNGRMGYSQGPLQGVFMYSCLVLELLLPELRNELVVH